jgi:hypothetical protein
MRAGAKKCALSVFVSLTLSVCISGLPLACPSSGQGLTPTVFPFDPEAARNGLGGGTVDDGYAPRLERLVAPAIMRTRGRASGECLPAGVGQATSGRSVVPLLGRIRAFAGWVARERASGRSGERESESPDV